MNITFTPLTSAHFSLLLKWLNVEYVKLWWDQEIEWTSKLIEEKYSSYVDGYTIENRQLKSIEAYIICTETIPIGYIQAYNIYDFNYSKLLQKLPTKLSSKLAGIDIFIGEESYLKRDFATKSINEFINNYLSAYTHVLVDPNVKNIAAIKTFEKAGFKKIGEASLDNIWMIKENSSAIQIRLPKYASDAMRVIFLKYFLENDQLWLFGSRTNLSKRGGDIDLYIETNIINYSTAFEKEGAFILELKKKIGEQKIDVVLRLLSSDKHLFIYDIAKSEGVQLV